MSTYEIGKICGIHYNTIRNWLKKHDIPRRSRSEYQKIAQNKPGVKEKKSGEEHSSYKENYEDLSVVARHARKKKELRKIGIFPPDYCPICNKPKGKRELDLMNIDHNYLDNTLDYYYMCRCCHIHKYHYLVGLVENKTIKPIPNLINNLLQLETREEREQLLKEVILNAIINK